MILSCMSWFCRCSSDLLRVQSGGQCAVPGCPLLQEWGGQVLEEDCTQCHLRGREGNLPGVYSCGETVVMVRHWGRGLGGTLRPKDAVFISVNTLWLYLVHLLFLSFTDDCCLSLSWLHQMVLLIHFNKLVICMCVQVMVSGTLHYLLNVHGRDFALITTSPLWFRWILFLVLILHPLLFLFTVTMPLLR